MKKNTHAPTVQMQKKKNQAVHKRCTSGIKLELWRQHAQGFYSFRSFSVAPP